MLSKETKILEFDEFLFVIYADIECLIEKIDGFKNNADITFPIKVGEHTPSRFSMPTISWFESKENKHDVYRGKNCMKKFCESLRENAMEIIDLKKKRNWSYLQTNSRNHMKSKILLYL